MVNNIWISDLFLKVTSNRIDTKISPNYEVKGYLRELARYVFLKLESSLVKTFFGFYKYPKGYENIVLTFVDDRCFTEGLYNDVFTGKLIQKLKGGVLIVPVFVKLGVVKKVQFYWYLRRNDIPVYLALHNVRFPKYNKFSHPERVVFNGIDFTKNFQNEVSRLAFRGISTDAGFETFEEFDLEGVRKIYYPFENQVWERFLCDSVRRNSSFRGELVGLQNAPVSLLSLRYIFPDNWNKYFPSPNEIVARDEISYRRLTHHWGKRCFVSKGTNQRKFIKIEKMRTEQSSDIFVALSIGVAESEALLKFIEVERIPGITYFVAFHPLLPQGLKRSLIRLSENVGQIKVVNYENGLRRCGYVMSTTSTALVEGLYNGLTPLKYVHDSFVSASPLDFNLDFDDYVSFGNVVELKKILNRSDITKKTEDVRKELKLLLD